MKTVLSPSRTKRSLKTCRMVTEVVENYEEVGQSLLGKGARRHREPSRSSWKKILNWFNKNEAIKRYLRSHIVHSVPRSSALENILPFYCRNYLKTRMCRCTPVGITRAKGWARIFQLVMFIFSKQELRNIKRHLKCQLSFVMNLYILFNVIQ